MGCGQSSKDVLDTSDRETSNIYVKDGSKASARSEENKPEKNPVIFGRAEDKTSTRVSSKGSKVPPALHCAFDPSEILVYDPNRFTLVRELQDAVRNRGKVNLMFDKVMNRYVACKRMPNHWVRNDHSEFMQHFPNEAECPWNDIGCHKYLDSIGYPYGCTLYGVYRDSENTDVVTTYASEGDLFSWSSGHSDVLLGPQREALVRPLAIQLIDSVRQLHDLSIVHRDVSMENILLSKPEGEMGTTALEVRLIDFGMASTQRTFQNCVRGKKSYQAPELHTAGGQYDAFLSDAFAVGVTLYCILTNDYPWLSTKPGQCKCFEFVKRHGFLEYARKRKLRGSGKSVADTMSQPVLAMLDGLLSLDPAKRLTLGEAAWRTEEGKLRKSAWDLAWLRDGRKILVPPQLVSGTCDDAVKSPGLPGKPSLESL